MSAPGIPGPPNLSPAAPDLLPSPPPGLPLPLPRMARQRPDQPALEWPGGAWTYAELAARAEDLAGRLAGMGLAPGDRLALCLPNGPAFVALAHAAQRLGLILVPLNTRLTAAELSPLIRDAEPGLLLTAADRVDGLRALPVRVLALDPDARAVLGPTSSMLLDPVWTEVAPLPVPPADPVAPDRPLAILYTSGTTGRPKGASLSQGNLVWSALGSALRLGIAPGDRWLVPLPLFHVGGLAVLVRCALAGATLRLSRNASPAALGEALDAGGVSMVSLVPTMLAGLLDAWGDRPAPPGLRAVLLGGGPIPPALVERALALGFPVARTYGLTEAASQVATTWPGDPPELGAPPLPFTELRVVDASGRDRAAGDLGEILVRGPTVMRGYWRDAAATAEALAGGWLHTGDLGRLDADGRLQVLGRRVDLIVSGGENVYPAEVEARLLEHPDIAEACVLGLPDPRWGERVLAVLVARAGRPAPAEAAIEAFLRPRLAGFKLPRRFLWLPELPRNAAGKVLRAELRDRVAMGWPDAGGP